MHRKFFVISYDLKTPDRDYVSLYDAIRSLGENRHPLESTWVVAADDMDPNAIYERLKSCIDKSDSILIFEVMPEECQGWLGKSFWEWMREMTK